MSGLPRPTAIRSGLLFLAILVVLVPPSLGQSLSDIVRGAQREGKLNLYGSMREDEAIRVFEAFNKRYPFVKIDYFRGDEERLVGRILTEARANTYNFDVLLTTSAYRVKEIRLADAYEPSEANMLRPELRDPDDMLTPVYINTNVIQYNTRLVAPADVPRSYEDLTLPKWRGKLCLENTDYEWFLGMMNQMGRERALDLFRRIAANRPTVRNGHGLLSDLVASGECVVAINNYGYFVGRALLRGAPVDMVAINPVITIIAPTAISKKAPHPNAARLYVDWISGKEGQQTLVSLGRFPVRIDLRPNPPRLIEGQRLIIQPPLVAEQLWQIRELYNRVWGIPD